MMPNVPTLTEVIQAGRPLGVDWSALEQRIVDAAVARLSGVMSQEVHASVGPAVTLLADRIAHKASQEVAAALAERLLPQLQQAVHEALMAAAQGAVYSEASRRDG